MNLKYLAYNLFKTDYKRLNKYINTLNKQGVSKRLIISDMLKSLFKDNTYVLDYFHFKYFNKEVSRNFYTNVWDMYKFQSKFNSREHYMQFRDKRLFRDRFDEYFKYSYYELKEISEIGNLINWIKSQACNKLVVKEPLGAVGKGVKVLKVSNQENQLLIDGLEASEQIKNLYDERFVLYESFIEQHPVLSSFHPDSVNTIRIISFLNELDEVEIWGALIRIGYDKEIDNFDAGGLGANIDVETGIITNEAIVKDPFADITYTHHPISGGKITGVQIPYWDEVIKMVNDVAKVVPQVRTVGWDIAISKNGPTLIEGNDNWNRVLFQLATGIGLNERIKRQLEENKGH